jgi:diadenosine tetraphosphate (Ap4A) HIT family hydrolase
MDCVFCTIVRGEAEASTAYEDERVVAFMDIAPATPGHLLVVPRRHAPHLADLDPEDGAQMFRVAQLLAAAVRRSSIPADGVNLLLADGAVAMQEVMHAHLHVLPRTEGDGLSLSAGFHEPDRPTLDAQAAEIADSLSGEPVLPGG